jgi:hypothetical protein
MTILYSILDHPRALTELNDAGVPTSKIRSLLDDYPHSVRQSPANFAFVSSASGHAGASQALPVATKTTAARSRRLKNIYGFIARKMNASTAATGARGKLALDDATMVTMNRKMRLVEPALSDSERRALLAALMQQEHQQLARHSRRPRGYFIKHLSALEPATGAVKKTALSRRASRKTTVD